MNTSIQSFVLALAPFFEVAVDCKIRKQTLTVETAGAIAKGRKYHVHIDAGVLEDLAGNALPQVLP